MRRGRDLYGKRVEDKRRERERIHEERDWELSQWMLNILTKVFQMCVIFVKFEKESEEEAEEIIII